MVRLAVSLSNVWSVIPTAVTNNYKCQPVPTVLERAFQPRRHLSLQCMVTHPLTELSKCSLTFDIDFSEQLICCGLRDLQKITTAIYDAVIFLVDIKYIYVRWSMSIL